jgi:hypothetical protein
MMGYISGGFNMAPCRGIRQRELITSHALHARRTKKFKHNNGPKRQQRLRSKRKSTRSAKKYHLRGGRLRSFSIACVGSGGAGHIVAVGLRNERV